MRKINLIIIHCSATRASQDIGAAEIDVMHKERGFASIGYHFVIRRDGTVERGRPISAVGAHAQGQNAHSIGVCMVGGVEQVKGKLVARDNFTPEQWVELERLIRELHSQYPQARIAGHREFANKECPSFSVKDWVKRVGILDGEFIPSGKPRNLAKTKTVQGSVMSGIGGLGSTLTEQAGTVQMVADYSTALQIVFVLLIIGGVALTIYGRIKVRERTGE